MFNATAAAAAPAVNVHGLFGIEFAKYVTCTDWLTASGAIARTSVECFAQNSQEGDRGGGDGRLKIFLRLLTARARMWRSCCCSC